jgi:hypothetical protein
MFELFAAQSELPMSPMMQGDRVVLEVLSPVKSTHRVLECMASNLVMRSMSGADSVTVFSQRDAVRVSTLMDEHGHELSVVRVPGASVDLSEAGFGNQLDEAIEELVVVGREGIRQWSRLAVKAKTLEGYENSFDEWVDFLEKNKIHNPFLSGCEDDVKVCVVSAFLLAKFRERPSRAAGCITSLKFAFERAVRSTEFMDHKSIKRLLNGFANYAHQSVNPRVLVVKSDVDVDIIREGWVLVDQGGIISFGTGNRLVATAVKLLAMLVLTLNMHFGFRISQSQPKKSSEKFEGDKLFEISLWFLEEDVLFLVQIADELVLFTWREYYKLAQVTRVACPVKKIFFQVANTKATHRSGTVKSKVARLPQLYQLSADVLGEELIIVRV